MNMFSRKELIGLAIAAVFAFFLMFALHDRASTICILFLLGLMCLAYLAMYLFRKNVIYKCKQCGAKGSMKYLGKKCVGEQQLRRLKETDSTGRRVQPYYVYGKVLKYRSAYRCTHCGWTKYEDSTDECWDDENIRP